MYDFFALKTERVDHTTMSRALLVPCVGVMTMGHGSRKMAHFRLWIRLLSFCPGTNYT